MELMGASETRHAQPRRSSLAVRIEYHHVMPTNILYSARKTGRRKARKRKKEKKTPKMMQKQTVMPQSFVAFWVPGLFMSMLFVSGLALLGAYSSGSDD
jgi:hypothetical protein